MPARIAPRASNVTEPALPDSVLRLAPPRAVVMAVGLGATPEANRVANPVINCCFSTASMVPLPFESVPISQPVPLACIRKLICVFLRTASNRVSFSMSDRRAAASFNWYVRNDRISVGIAMAVKIKSTVMDTANSTMLKPPMRLRRVREMGALLDKVISSFNGRICGPAYKDDQESNMMQLPYQGQIGATAAKHSTF